LRLLWCVERVAGVRPTLPPVEQEVEAGHAFQAPARGRVRIHVSAPLNRCDAEPAHAKEGIAPHSDGGRAGRVQIQRAKGEALALVVAATQAKVGNPDSEPRPRL